jgi:phosphonate transport system substrate-binding protein
MQISRRPLLAGLVGLFPLLALKVASAQMRDMKLAVTDVVGLENLQREYAPFQRLLSEKAGARIDLFPVPNRTASVEALNARRVDLVLTGPAEYVVFKKRTDAKLVVGLARNEYFGTIVTLASSGIDSVDDLKGKKVALGDVGSTSRHLAPIQLLADLGIDPRRDVQIVHINRNVGVEAMRRGDVAAIGVNRSDMAGLQRRFPDVIFKVIARGRDLPNDMILAGAHVPDDTVALLRRVFSENSAALISAILLGPDENQKFQGMRFVPTITDRDYNYVRKMYATIGQPQFADFVGD